MQHMPCMPRMQRAGKARTMTESTFFARPFRRITRLLRAAWQLLASMRFAVGLLVCGPMSDRLGRRPVLLGGVAVYAAGSAVCALLPSIYWLIGAAWCRRWGPVP